MIFVNRISEHLIIFITVSRIFTAHPELRIFYDVEDIDVDDIPKSRNIQQRGAGVLSSIKNLISNFDNEKQFRLEVKELACAFKEMNMKASDVKVRLQFLDTTYTT